MSLIDIINSHGKSRKNIAAHTYRDSIITYGELKEMSDSLAGYLIEKYGYDDTPIIVYGHKQKEMLVCFLACVKAGHAYIPIDSSLPYERIKDIIDSSGAKMIFSIGDLFHIPPDVSIIYLNEIHELINRYSTYHPEKCYAVKEDNVYYIIYTSGSTGKPKGVQITLSNLNSFVKWGLSLLRQVENSDLIFLNQAPFSFDLSIMDLYLSLASGSTLFSVDKEMIANPKELFSYLNKSQADIWVSTPSFADMCLADKSFNRFLMPKLKVMMFCGEVLNNGSVRKIHERFCGVKVINTYGPTEATVAVTSVEITKEVLDAFDPLPVGYVKSDCHIIIADSEGREVEMGEKGEIVIAGESVSIGYYKNPEITEKVFFKRAIEGKELRCYRTGDEGYIKNNNLHYSGRIDFQVKLNGYRIELEDIESNLRKIDFIENAVVLPVLKEQKIQYLTAAVALNRMVEATEFKTGLLIKNELKKFIPEYMIPRKIVIRESLPMTANGKINRKALMEEIK
ncbi:D-alanine--poly(phosphoribitol) ligase subunit 1 [Oxobacter pfennigii]|uniref:D-alanine--D-alanyl carrier protein ligase n=1 Tax=Oxobacter pfennigii TaxID=36849 RepID=A0A0P8W2Q4_9CLOT|nr:D-alanine--poly(phosphoribitol) ligase subunit DltA [Oxobacter pfennigii]KPU42799.1 D-alanine--poly(phosphoribitol) ligase subunit 1 [Oxobacter pfennigii]